MVKVIMGVKGTGKTKQLIDMVRAAVNAEHGDVVCLEKNQNLTYDIPYRARLIFANQYDFGSIEFFKGFISGLHSGNYDITEVFIDNLYKMVDDKSDETISELLAWLDSFGQAENINFTLTLSAAKEGVCEGIAKYLIPNA